MSRQPTAATYDAFVGLEPCRAGDTPRFAYALCKMTYEVKAGRVVSVAPEPLEHDVYTNQGQEPKLPPGSDFWVCKTATDVVVRGSAFAPGGRPIPSLDVQVVVGKLAKRIAVFGRREIRQRADGRFDIAAAEPFSEIPLHYGNAYGGLDPRVPIPEGEREEYLRYAAMGLVADHPGLYPRNPIGKGYLVYPELIAGLEMPNLEDPADRLTPDRLVVGKPERWYRQPLPWCFEWMPAMSYPRELYLGFDAWFPCRDASALPEIRRGFLAPAALSPPPQWSAPAPEYYQEASLGLVTREPLQGQTVKLTGMHPDEPQLSFTVPMEPRLDIQIEGQKVTPRPLLTNLVLRPAEKKMCAVWCAKTGPLPRAFIPQVHKDIPLSVSVNGDRPVRYQSPPTVRDRLAAASVSGPPSPSK